jgi:hypothetical protein
MLRAERPRLSTTPPVERAQFSSRDLLLAVAPPPETHVFPLSGWPEWLIPTSRSGGVRTELHSRSEER